MLCRTRVSNELGAGNAQAAKITVKAIIVLVVAEMVIVAMILFFCHRVLVYAFRSKKEIADMGPLLCLSIVIFQVTFSHLSWS